MSSEEHVVVSTTVTPADILKLDLDSILSNSWRDTIGWPEEDKLIWTGIRLLVRLRPGVLLKLLGDCPTEAEAHHFAFNAGLPVPRLLRPLPNEPRENIWYLCMEECQGSSLDKVIGTMTPPQLDDIARQLQSVLRRIRSVNSPLDKPFLGSVSGGPYHNLLFREPAAPTRAFDNIDEFIENFREVYEFFCSPGYTEKIKTRLPASANVVFTHGDLLPKNIMVKGSRITGIIDWATAGFYPDYWEYARMHDIHWMTPNWGYVLARVFPQKPDTEIIITVRELLDVMEINCWS